MICKGYQTGLRFVQSALRDIMIMFWSVEELPQIRSATVLLQISSASIRSLRWSHNASSFSGARASWNRRGTRARARGALFHDSRGINANPILGAPMGPTNGANTRRLSAYKCII